MRNPSLGNYQDIYGNDPLAPCRYPLDTLFAMVIAGRGNAAIANGVLKVMIPAKLDFVWVKIDGVRR